MLSGLEPLIRINGVQVQSEAASPTVFVPSDISFHYQSPSQKSICQQSEWEIGTVNEKKAGRQPYNHITHMSSWYKANINRCQEVITVSESRAKNILAIVGSLTCKLQGGSTAYDGPPHVEGCALVYPGALVLVQVANDQAAPRHVTPVVILQINECSV